MNKNGKKNFKGWIKIKEALHLRGRLCDIKEGEVWWSSVGENVGVEICGKGKSYTRPVVVLRKIGRYSFWAVPLTSKQHKGSWYVSFEFQGNKETAVISQIQCMSVSRLHRRMGQLSVSDYELVYEGFLNFAAKRQNKKCAPELAGGCAGRSRKCT